MKQGSPGNQASAANSEPAAVAEYRQRLSRGENVVDPRPGRALFPPPRASRLECGWVEPMVQPAMAAADRFGSPAGRRRRGPGLWNEPAVERFIARYPATLSLRDPLQGCRGGWMCPALPQRVLHDFHHPGRPADPGRSSAAVLDEALNARKEWFRLQKPVPDDPLWTAKQDSIACRGMSGCRDSGIRSGWRAGGTSAATCSGS